jgi:hypothetical protein
MKNGTLKALLLFVICYLPIAAQAQIGYRYDNVTLLDTGRPVQGAALTVCKSGSTGTPCTPTTPIFSDAAMSTPITQPGFQSGAQGNFNFYAPCDRYDISFTGNGLTSRTLKDVQLGPCNNGAGKISIAAPNDFQSLEYLGSTFISVAAASTNTITIAARDYILCRSRITSYAGGGDIAQYRFNADATAANYQTRYIVFSNAATPAVSSVNFCSTGCSAAATGIPLGDASITVGRNNELECSNRLSNNKVCQLRHSWESTSSTVFNSTAIGYAEWFNTSAQITTVQLVTLGGVNMGAGSGFACFGKNF